MRNSRAFNPMLTGYARVIAQRNTTPVADALAPMVKVGATIGQYKSFDTKSAFQVYKTARASGGGSTRITFEGSDPTYNCKAHGLEHAIDDQDRDTYGQGDPLGIERMAVENLTIGARLARESRVITAINAAVTAEAGVGVWGSNSNDPIAEIDAQILAIATNIGQMPNRIVFGLNAWSRLVHNANVLGRMPGADLQDLNPGRVARMITLNPAIEIYIGTMVQDNNKPGQSESKAQVVGSECYIFFGSSNANLMDASFAKTFTGGRGGISQVRKWRDENAHSDIVSVDWSEDVQVTASIAGKRITTSDS